MPAPFRSTVVEIKPSALDELRRLNAIDALDLILDRQGLGFVMTALEARYGVACLQGALERVAELNGQRS